MLREITLLVPEEIVEALGDALIDEGVFSVSIEDADAESELEKPLFGEPGLEPKVLAWTNSRLKLLVDETINVKDVLARACHTVQTEVPEIIEETTVPDQDWVRLTQAQFSPTKVSDRLWIVPTWHEPPNSEAINIRLDPGVAFGTGSHPTTHLCLQWLDSHCQPGDSVLDYGCGTGILAIAAAKVGARLVKGTDIDPQAIESATYNASVNSVNATFHLPEDLKNETFDVVIANILANPLKILAPALIARIATHGTIVLSGILSHQAQEVISTYAALAPMKSFSVWKEQEGWVCIVGK